MEFQFELEVDEKHHKYKNQVRALNDIWACLYPEQHGKRIHFDDRESITMSLSENVSIQIFNNDWPILQRALLMNVYMLALDTRIEYSISMNIPYYQDLTASEYRAIQKSVNSENMCIQIVDEIKTEYYRTDGWKLTNYMGDQNTNFGTLIFRKDIPVVLTQMSARGIL